MESRTSTRRRGCRVAWAHALASLAQAGFFVWYQFRPGVLAITASPRDLLTLVYSFVTLNLLVLWVGAVSWGHRSLYLGLVGGVLVLTAFASGYHLNTKSTPDWSILRDNLAEIVDPNGFATGLGYIGPAGLAVAALVVLALIVGERRARLFSRDAPPPSSRRLGLTTLAYAAVLVAPLNTFDELTLFLRTVPRHDVGADAGRRFAEGTFPLVRPRLELGETAPLTWPPEGRRPPLVVVAVESFSQYFVDREDPATGRPYTPVFNELRHRGLAVAHYYGNSIQTAKGTFALLFSMIPSISGKVFRNYAQTHFSSLPSQLGEAGYHTVFLQAYADQAFDNTFEFLGRNGFAALAAGGELARPADAAATWGWGLQDDVFYRRAFERLDAEHARHPAAPLFVYLATIGSHTPFDDMPPNLRLLHPEPRTHLEKFANATALADRHLLTLLDELSRRDYLRDACVVITGDHAYPVGLHGLEFAGTGAFEEFFRVPFLLFSPGHPGGITPRDITDRAHSHLDVAPTLMHLAGVTAVPHHFQGVSLLDTAPPEHPVPLVQPYEGRTLGLVDLPWKYLRHLRTGDEFLYDVVADPLEGNNLMEFAPAERVERMRAGLDPLWLNQTLIARDAVWPH